MALKEFSEISSPRKKMLINIDSVQRAIEQVLFALLLTRLAFKWSEEMHM